MAVRTQPQPQALYPRQSRGFPAFSPSDQGPVAADPELRVLQAPGAAHPPSVAHYVPQALAGVHAEEAAVLGDAAAGRPRRLFHGGAAPRRAAAGPTGLEHREGAQGLGGPRQVARHRAAREMRNEGAHRGAAGARGRWGGRPALVLAAADTHPRAVPGGARAHAGVGQQQVVVQGGPAELGREGELGGLWPGRGYPRTWLTASLPRSPGAVLTPNPSRQTRPRGS